MYRNLEAELARAGVRKHELATVLGCTPSTLTLKLSGRAPIRLSEAVKIKDCIGTDISLEELFADDQSEN